MKVNGFSIKQSMKLLAVEREALDLELSASYSKYPAEEKRTPAQILADIQANEESLILLQTQQAKYNSLNEVEWKGKKVPLSYVIKLDGVIGRMAKFWKDTSKQNQSSARYEYDKDKVYPVSQVDQKECLTKVKELTKELALTQSIIGTANGRDVEIGEIGA